MHRTASGDVAPRRASLARRLLPVVVILWSVTLVSIALTLASIAVQSAVRGYVAGEGLWSNAQRDAAHQLLRYGQTRDEAHYAGYEAALRVPLGDRTAREALQRDPPDVQAARAGFLAGGNHPDDIGGMILLFRCCSRLDDLAEVIALWTRGDEQIDALRVVAADLRAEITGPRPSHERIDALLARVETHSEIVQPLAAAFSARLGDAARWVSRLLTLTTTTITLLLLGLGGLLSIRIVDGIRRSETQYRVLMDSASDGLAVVDERGEVLEVNARLARMTGRPAGALVGRPFTTLFDETPPWVAAGLERVDAPDAGGRLGTLAIAGGPPMAIEATGSATTWTGRSALLVTLRDVGERLRAERDLRIAANAMANLAEGVVITDARLRVVSVNPAFTRITEWTADEAIGRPALPASPVSGGPVAIRTVLRALRRDGRWHGELEGRRRGGQPFQMKLSVATLCDERGRITHCVGVLNDHSRVRAYERRLQYMARHDALTRLPNRTSLEERGRQAIAEARRLGRRLATLFVDLDGFKGVNDTFGHPAGDRLLKVVAARIGETVREGDIVARVGGDEFVVLIDAPCEESRATMIARRLLARIAEPIEVDGHALGVSASIGIAHFPDDGAGIDALLGRADIAMYAAKGRGRNNFQVFTAEMAVANASRLALVNGLRQAIDTGALRLHFQPYVDIAGGRVAGVEALARWTHPELGAVSPDVFVPLAEEIGLIDRLSDWVLREACTQAMRWRTAGHLDLVLSVNLSPRNFWDADLPGRIARTLADTGWPAQRLCLEITETAIMGTERPETALQRLADMGVRIAIDDFGVGYSSLSHLRRFPVHVLKVDRSFVRTLAEQAGDRAIVATIVALARGLGLAVQAEGVETAEQHRALAALGCDAAQGYLYARPLPPEQTAELLGRRLVPEDAELVGHCVP